MIVALQRTLTFWVLRLMKLSDLRDLLLLAALWGGSFLFMRVGVPAFGPVPMIELRVLFAALLLLPLLAHRRQLNLLADNKTPLLLLGVLTSALPFCLFAFAMIELTSGFTSIINASTPLFGAIIAAVFLAQQLTKLKVIGLIIGFAGVVSLILSRGTFSMEAGGLSIAAAVFAALSYGIAANYSSQALKGVPSLAIAGGSQLAAALVLAVPAIVFWPSQAPSMIDWLNMLVLGFLCTGIAYLLYFRLIENLGATGAVSVTFLIPAFAMLWGGLIIDEEITSAMVVSCLIILVGTALTTGLLTQSSFNRLVGNSTHVEKN